MSNRIAIIASSINPIKQAHLLDWYKNIKDANVDTQLFIGSKNKAIPFAKNYKINSQREKLAYFFKGKIAHKNQPLIDYNPDIIHLLTSNAFVGVKGALKDKTHLIVSFRGYDINVFPQLSPENLKLTKEIFERADKLHFISKDLMNTAISLGADKNKSLVIYRSVNTGIKPKLSNRKNKETVIVSIGRLVWEKGYENALKALSVLKEKNIDYKYIIAGDGVESANLKVLAKKLKIDNRVQFLGGISRDKVIELLVQADIYFQPSVTEALSNAIIEASFYSLPVVSSNVGGIPEVIDNERSGFLTPVGDVEKYAESLIKLIENEDLRITMGEVGHRIICERFSRKDEIDKWLTLYNSF